MNHSLTGTPQKSRLITHSPWLGKMEGGALDLTVSYLPEISSCMLRFDTAPDKMFTHRSKTCWLQNHVKGTSVGMIGLQHQAKGLTALPTRLLEAGSWCVHSTNTTLVHDGLRCASQDARNRGSPSLLFQMLKEASAYVRVLHLTSTL